MSDMKASVTLELIEKGFEKADRAAKSLDRLAKAGKKADSTRGNIWSGDRAARSSERAFKAETRHAQAINQSTNAMRRQRTETQALERQQRRLEQTQQRAMRKAAVANAQGGLHHFGAGAGVGAMGRKVGGLGLSFLGGMGIGAGLGGSALAAETAKAAARDEFERDQLQVLGSFDEARMAAHRKSLDKVAAKRGVGTQGAYGVFGGLMAGGLSDRDAAAMTDSVVVFAKATRASTEDAARSTVALRNQMGITAEKMISAYDAIALGGKAGQFEVADMARNLPSMLAKMSKLGELGATGVRNTVAMAQAVRKATGTSDEAATNFENMLDKFTAADFVENAKDIGINIEKTMADANKNGASPVLAVLKEINRATAGSQTKLSKLLPDTNAQAAVVAILRNMGEVQKLVTDMEGAGGTVMKDYVTATDNASAAWDRFAANVTTKAKVIAEVALPWVTSAMNKVSDAMENGIGGDTMKAPDGSSPEVRDGVARANERGAEINNWLEQTFGLRPSKETEALRKRDAYIDYGNSLAAGDRQAASRSAMAQRNARLRASSSLSAGGPQSRAGRRPKRANDGSPMPSPRPDIEKAMRESGQKAEGEAKKTVSAIETILQGMDTYAAGLKAGNQFAAGLRASAPAAAAAANSVASSVASHFPQSPAKAGPLRKLPAMGRKISAQLAGGMGHESPARAATRIAARIASQAPATGGGKAASRGAAGGRNVQVSLGGITITGVSDPQAAADQMAASVRRRLDGVLGDVGMG